MGIRRMLSVIGIGLSFSAAAACVLRDVDMMSLSNAKDAQGHKGSKKDIYRMPNADTQYYKKYQREIK